MTDAFKDRIKAKLAANLAAGIEPRDQAELAGMIGVDRSAITKMFQAHSSKLVDPIVKALGIDDPMIATPATDEDPLIAFVNGLDARQRARALVVLRTVFD